MRRLHADLRAPPPPPPAPAPPAAVVLFCMTVCRFHFRQYSLLFLFQSITYAMTTTSHYHTAANFYEFVWYWCAGQLRQYRRVAGGCPPASRAGCPSPPLGCLASSQPPPPPTSPVRVCAGGRMLQ